MHLPYLIPLSVGRFFRPGGQDGGGKAVCGPSLKVHSTRSLAIKAVLNSLCACVFFVVAFFIFGIFFRPGGQGGDGKAVCGQSLQTHSTQSSALTAVLKSNCPTYVSFGKRLLFLEPFFNPVGKRGKAGRQFAGRVSKGIARAPQPSMQF